MVEKGSVARTAHSPRKAFIVAVGNLAIGSDGVEIRIADEGVTRENAPVVFAGYSLLEQPGEQRFLCGSPVRMIYSRW